MSTAGKRAGDAALRDWFAARGWTPAPFQREAWRRQLDGESGLIVTPTGSGKTLAAIGGALLLGMREQGRRVATATAAAAKAAASRPATKRGAIVAAKPTMAPSAKSTTKAARATANAAPRLRVLWITPLRALASDTARALREPIAALGLDWTVAMRTGDATARDKRLARTGQVDVLVITPESLALLLSYDDTAAKLAGVGTVVVDEWHELLGNKRGVLLQLCLARIRAIAPAVSTWGLSATIGNLDEARDVLLPHAPRSAILSAAKPRAFTLETLLPEAGERFPWAGHLGLSQLARVAQLLHQARTSLLFTNTRSQAELWHRALSSTWLDDPATLALHHGSLDPTLRHAAEQGLRDGTVRCVVATSSLDLGVDFPAVDQVLTVGSPKGMSRLLQRAGRARHRPGEAGHIVCVPTHALELVEYAAARRALARGEVEARLPPRLSLDVLAQHAVTMALAGGFHPHALFDEVRGTHAFATLSVASWQAVLDFIVQGGAALSSYPDFRRVQRDPDGIYRVHDQRLAFRHRLSIGTITSDGSVQVRFMKGGKLGAVEEQFVGRMRPGDRFQFAGKTLELVQLRDMVAYVRVAKSGSGAVPRWQGGRMPMSTALAHEVEAVLAAPDDSPEMTTVAPLLAVQRELSTLPAPGRLLVETMKTREGWHLFAYPFAGRAVHEGIAALVALRFGRRAPNTFGIALNDYGFALTAQAPFVIDEAALRALFSRDEVLADLVASLNLAELARRQFREIARVAGLLPPSLPGKAPRSLRQLQASSGLLYDVLRRYDPDHMLLGQAEREVLEEALELPKLVAALDRIADARIDLRRPPSLTPLSFPLWAETMRAQLSTEDWQTRVRRAAEKLEARHAAIDAAAATRATPGRRREVVDARAGDDGAIATVARAAARDRHRRRRA